MADPAQVIQALGGINGEPVSNEALAAAATAILPGYLVEEILATVREHSTAAANAQKLIALTNTSNGGTIDDVYAVGETVRYGAFSTGQKGFLRLAASAAAIVVGDVLESAGDGTVRIATADAATDTAQRDAIVAYAVEAVDNSGGGTEVFIEVRFAQENHMGKLITSFGESRHEHAAMIAMHPQNWNGYELLHNELFAEHNLHKWHVIDTKGELITNGDDKQALLTNANGTVRHEDFLVIRDMVIEVRRRDLHGIADLREAGLSFTAALGEQLIGFESVNEFQAAKQDMNPTSFDNNDTTFIETFVPNPITHSTFSVPWRQEGFNYKRSLGLAESLRQVSERLEETLTNGNTSVVVSFNDSNHGIFGYTTDPNRGTDTISDWTLEANRDKIVNEAIEQIGLMWTTQGGVKNDSVMIYVANDIWTILQKDYITGQVSESIADRLMKIAQVKGVKPLEKLASKNVVMVEMDRRTVELGVASDIIVTPHTKTNVMKPQVMTTYAAMVQKIKSDSKGNTGVRHLTI